MSSIAVARRAEQSAALQKGLAFSAGLHLTLAVLLFGVFGLVRNLPTPPIEPPGDEEVRIILPPPKWDEGGSPPTPPVEDVAGPAEIKPVDEDEAVINDDMVIDARPEVPVEGEGSGMTPGGDPTESGGSGEFEAEGNPNPNDPQIFDIEPEAIRRVLPIYPDMARQIGQEGEVIVRVLVGKDGAVRNVEIQKSSGMFDDAALVAVRQWTFRPAIWQGRPVAVWVRIPIRFRMN